MADLPAVYLAANSDRVYCVHMAKLLDKAPNSWIAKAILGRAPADASGSTQDKPLFLPVPGWFIQAVADWCMPLSTGSVFFEHPHDGVVEVLTAMGWPAADGGDLPVHLPATVVPTAIGTDGHVFMEMINDHMSNRVAKACGYMSGVWLLRHVVVLSSNPQNEVAEVNKTVTMLPKECWDTMSRLLPGKLGEIRNVVINCSNGVYVVSVGYGATNRITIFAFY